MRRFVVVLILTFFATVTQADWIAPSERVREGISIRKGPSSSSAYIGKLGVGERLEYLRSVPYWYEVRLANGEPAFVSKAWSTLVPESVPVATGPYTLDAIDVGTGLAVLVQGPDFALLYDGGSNDDFALGPENRLSAFLAAAYPNLVRIDHVILSHPHRDHVELLPDVMSNLEIGDVWDSGAVNDICGYRAFIDAVVAGGSTYHTALRNHGTHNVSFPKNSGKCYGMPRVARDVAVDHGSQIDEQPIVLGQGATMRFLHASGSKYNSFNENSLAVRVDLGNHRILFMGDAEAGSRKTWSAGDPKSDSIEGVLLACCAVLLRSDILIAGHHGSQTSSRTGFLDAVQASTYVVSSGPKKYGSVVLPDQYVVDELDQRGDVFRTDRDDLACASDGSKIGPDTDGKAGGCDNIRITLESGITTQYITLSD
jgi:beta-lactamase superfamily II metal-dependent hydrolase